MGYALVFWNQDGNDGAPQTIYELLQNGDKVRQVEKLPINQVLHTLEREFEDWTHPDADSFEKEGRGAFQVATTPYLVEFNCYGMLSDDMNRLIDIMLPFGCFLYDPQTNERFAG